MYHTLKTIAGGFIGGQETNSSRKRYARQILSVENLPQVNMEGELEASEAKTAFSEKYATDIHTHKDDTMVIVVKREDWEINRVLVDQGSFAYILY